MSCAHVVAEVWETHRAMFHEMQADNVIEPLTSMGAVGYQGWHIPRYTGANDPTLFTYLGLAGEQNRRKLAETFLRPTSWKEYCDFVSLDQCQTPDSVSSRAPQDDGVADETDRYFLQGLYTGHFRATEKNDCDSNPTTCTGHIVDYPCDWTSFIAQQTRHLNIAVESNGPAEPGGTSGGGYSYTQMSDIWHAANATRSNVLMLWWTPQALFETFMDTDYEFQRISLTPPTQACYNARLEGVNRCRVGGVVEEDEDDDHSAGSCDDEPQILKKAIARSFYEITYDDTIQEARRSPAYDAIQAFSISSLQLSKLLGQWLDRNIDTWNFDPRNVTCEWVVENFSVIKEFVPRTYPRIIQEHYSASSSGISMDPLFVAAMTVSCLATMVVLLSAAMTYRLRAHRAMVYAQVEFLWILLAGLLLVSVGAIVSAIEPSNGSCIATVWLTNVGYTLELVPLIVKVAAINRLLKAAQNMRRVVLKRKSLYGTVFGLCFVIIIYLAIWTGLDPPHQQFDYTLTTDTTKSEDPENGVEFTFVVMSSYCYSESEVWNYISASWYSLMLLWATILTFQSSKLRHQILETRTLVLMIYSHFFFVILRVTIFFMEDSLGVSRVPRYLSLIYSSDAIATIIIYFIPKFLAKDESPSSLMNAVRDFVASAVGVRSRSRSNARSVNEDVQPSEESMSKASSHVRSADEVGSDYPDKMTSSDEKISQSLDNFDSSPSTEALDMQTNAPIANGATLTIPSVNEAVLASKTSSRVQWADNVIGGQDNDNLNVDKIMYPSENIDTQDSS
jgi:hypothetical protein